MNVQDRQSDANYDRLVGTRQLSARGADRFDAYRGLLAGEGQIGIFDIMLAYEFLERPELVLFPVRKIEILIEQNYRPGNKARRGQFEHCLA